MVIAHYFPNNFMAVFEKYLPQHRFICNNCDDSADIIYAGNVSTLGQAVVAKNKFKKPLVCWVWDIPYNWREWSSTQQAYNENKFRDNNIAVTIKRLCQCNLVISSSKYTQKVLKDRYGIPSEQIYFYIDTEQLDSIQQPEKQDQIIQISRYYYNKKFEVSIEATANLNYKFVTVGMNTNYCRNLKILAKKLNNNVEFHCNVPRHQAIQLLKSSKILVSPSVFEGWGITPIEALHCGIPVILNDLEVFREVYGSTVMYHKPNDPVDLNKRLKTLIKNEDIQEKIVKWGRVAIESFIPEKFAERWMKLIEQV